MDINKEAEEAIGHRSFIVARQNLLRQNDAFIHHTVEGNIMAVANWKLLCEADSPDFLQIQLPIPIEHCEYRSDKNPGGLWNPALMESV